MENLFLTIQPEHFIALAANIFILLVLFIMNISNRINLKKLRTKYNKFMNGMGDKNIEGLLEDCIDKLKDVSAKNRELEMHINNIERNMIQCIQKVGMVRYNAFENVGSDLSYSIALLDNNDNGVVISGIYSRDSSSTYAKPITSGKSKYALSAEEIQALESARKINREKQYMD